MQKNVPLNQESGNLDLGLLPAQPLHMNSNMHLLQKRFLCKIYKKKDRGIERAVAHCEYPYLKVFRLEGGGIVYKGHVANCEQELKDTSTTKRCPLLSCESQTRHRQLDTAILKSIAIPS